LAFFAGLTITQIAPVKFGDNAVIEVSWTSGSGLVINCYVGQVVDANALCADMVVNEVSVV